MFSLSKKNWLYRFRWSNVPESKRSEQESLWSFISNLFLNLFDIVIGPIITFFSGVLILISMLIGLTILTPFFLSLVCITLMFGYRPLFPWEEARISDYFFMSSQKNIIDTEDSFLTFRKLGWWPLTGKTRPLLGIIVLCILLFWWFYILFKELIKASKVDPWFYIRMTPITLLLCAAAGICMYVCFYKGSRFATFVSTWRKKISLVIQFSDH